MERGRYDMEQDIWRVGIDKGNNSEDKIYKNCIYVSKSIVFLLSNTINFIIEKKKRKKTLHSSLH